MDGQLRTKPHELGDQQFIEMGSCVETGSPKFIAVVDVEQI
jgi:hypothetical protein